MGTNRTYKAVVLLSGGLDSSTVCALACAQYTPSQVLCVTCEYGQKHSKETDAAYAVAHHYGCACKIIHIDPYLFQGAGSTLMDGGQVPPTTYKELQEAEGPSPTVVPYRNGVLLSMATAIAVSKKAETVWCGVHAEDWRNWAYPDCSPEWVGSMANAIYIGSYQQVRLMTPLTWLMKKDVVRMGQDLRVPFAKTWTCYNGGSVACGTCPSCQERRAAFAANDLQDPLPYAHNRAGQPKEPISVS